MCLSDHITVQWCTVHSTGAQFSAPQGDFRLKSDRVSVAGGKKEQERVRSGLGGINFTMHHNPKLILASLTSQE